MANIEEGIFLKVKDLSLLNPVKYTNTLVRVVETTRVPPFRFAPGFYESDGSEWKPFVSTTVINKGETIVDNSVTNNGIDECKAIAYSIVL